MCLNDGVNSVCFIPLNNLRMMHDYHAHYDTREGLYDKRPARDSLIRTHSYQSTILHRSFHIVEHNRNSCPGKIINRFIVEQNGNFDSIRIIEHSCSSAPPPPPLVYQI